MDKDKQKALIKDESKYSVDCGERRVNASFSNELLCDAPEVTKESILDAVKLIAKLKPERVEPFSLGDVGGVKIISSPMVPEGSIIVSDDIYLLLQELSNT